MQELCPLPATDPTETLGRLLYEEMERLAPTAEDAPWEGLEDWERDMHLRGVRRLLAERDLILSALALADERSCQGR